EDRLSPTHAEGADSRSVGALSMSSGASAPQRLGPGRGEAPAHVAARSAEARTVALLRLELVVGGSLMGRIGASHLTDRDHGGHGRGAGHLVADRFTVIGVHLRPALDRWHPKRLAGFGSDVGLDLRVLTHRGILPCLRAGAS